MDLQLYRSELLSVGSISAKNTLAILPLGRHKRQKLVVGDDGGCVTCFQFKKGEPVQVFKALCGDGNDLALVYEDGVLRSRSRSDGAGSEPSTEESEDGDELELTDVMDEALGVRDSLPAAFLIAFLGCMALLNPCTVSVRTRSAEIWSRSEDFDSKCGELWRIVANF